MTLNVYRLPKSAKVRSYSLYAYGSSVKTSKSISRGALRHGLRSDKTSDVCGTCSMVLLAGPSLSEVLEGANSATEPP